MATKCEHPRPVTGDNPVEPHDVARAGFRNGVLRIAAGVPASLVGRQGENEMSTMTRSFLVCLLVVLSAGLMFGQGGAYGTILGTVTDNSGAVVAKASVDVTNIGTNVTKQP